MLFKNSRFIYYVKQTYKGSNPSTSEAKFKRKETYHLTILTGSFFGIIWFSHGSMTGNWSISWFLIPLITEVFSWMQFDTFSFSSNLPSERKYFRNAHFAAQKTLYLSSILWKCLWTRCKTLAVPHLSNFQILGFYEASVCPLGTLGCGKAGGSPLVGCLCP